jgi:deoxyribodipyrimidine photo-lyase
MSYNKSLFIFHRSLRLDDNHGLHEALKESKYVIPIFIFTPEQITTENKYRSINAITFMIDALKNLNDSIQIFRSKLYIFYGKQHEILKKILEKDNDIEAVYVNRDYTPYAVERESKLKKISEDLGREFISHDDYLLHSIDTIKTKTGTFYSVFSPFYASALKFDVVPVKMLKYKNFINIKYFIKNETSFDTIQKIYLGSDDNQCTNNQGLFDFIATRDEGLKRVKHIKHHKNYHDNRNKLFLETTQLSPYIKFGLVSIREIYHRILKLYSKTHDLIRQLYWREFYYGLSYNRQDILQNNNSFKESYDNISWNWTAKDKKLFDKWKKGETGYPVVDAGMRELNYTGYMHNRARLITSNFLVKHLFIDWRKGEEYFSSKLIDYDPSVNNGNWQFISGSGTDSQPYFRMMNPWTQGLTHDFNCGYIKAWIPELENVLNEDIHDWQNKHSEYDVIYPAPCKVYDFNKLKKESKKVYSKAFKH